MSDSQPQQQPQQPQKGVAAVGFLVVAFLDEHAADQALDAMKEAKKQKKFYFEDAAVIRQDVNGKVHYHETGDMSSGKGAGVGALVGGVLGILGGPAGVMVGTGAGAAVGAALAHHDAGFKNESLGTVGTALKPGTSAVAAITSDAFLKAVHEHIPQDEIRTVVRNLASELSARLAENKNVAIGLLLSQDGLAIREIAANEEGAEVVAAVVTNEAAAVGAAVITPEGGAYEVAVETKDGIAVETGKIVPAQAIAAEAPAKAPAADAPVSNTPGA